MTDLMSRWTRRLLIAACYALPPWNVGCWVLALMYWAVRAALGIAYQGEVSEYVLRAPVELPARVLSWIRLARRRSRNGSVDEPPGAVDRRVMDRAVIELCTMLYDKGFYIREAKVDAEGYARVRVDIWLDAGRLVEGNEEPMPIEDRFDLFGDIVATIYRQFPEIMLDKFCSRMEPLEALDADWGRMHGMPEHARQAYTAPCTTCGRCKGVDFVFGTAKMRRIYDDSMAQKRTYVSQKGQRFEVNGHYCDDCRNAAGLILVIGARPEDHEPDDRGEE